MDTMLYHIPTILLILTGISTLYFLFFVIASHSKKKEVGRVLHPTNRKIRVLIPARKEHTNIEECAIRSLMQSYDNNDFEVVIIADGLPGTTLLELQGLDVSILPLDLEVKTNANAIREAMKHLDPRDTDIYVLVDPDHVQEFDFLEKINNAYNQGDRVMQGHVTPKKRNTIAKRLIAANEEINNAIFRKGPARLGLSPVIKGVGMAFESRLLHRLVRDIDGAKSFTREMDRCLRIAGIKVSYLPTARIFTERLRFGALLKFPLGRSLHYLKNLGRFAKKNQPSEFFDGLLRSILPCKLLTWTAGIAAGLYFQDPQLLASTLAFTGVLLIAVPRKLYRAQLREVAAGLPRVLRFMFKYTGGETIIRKSIRFKNLPLEYTHEDRHRSTANI